MFKSDRILTLDIGASRLVLAEFAPGSPGGAPVLERFGVAELGVSKQESDPSAYIVAALHELVRNEGFRPGPVLIALSGQSVFPRYVKLPPVGRDKIQQMIRYEAEQNVPFPIDEVVWNYQLVGDSSLGEQDVFLVAVKKENVTPMTESVRAAGFDPELVDVAPLALYNCVRYNYEDNGCTLVLDIGARNTNLLCIEKNRIFSRSIPVAGNNITQEIANNLKIGFDEAEQLKCRLASVSPGGAFAPDDDPEADRVAKVVRNVATRLHAEVSRSINFYRSQQSGSQPSRVLLTGGSAVIPNLDVFFRDKLKAETELLNPFVNLSVGSRLDEAAVSDEIVNLGVVSGLALRRRLSCPIEINLMPPELIRERAFRRCLPYFGLAAAGLILTFFSWALYASQMRRIYDSQRQALVLQVEELRRVSGRLDRELESQSRIMARIASLEDVVGRREFWPAVFEGLGEAMLPGMWIVAVEPLRDNGGRVSHLRLRGRGFRDAMDEAAVEEDGRMLTAVERLRNRVNRQPVFSESSIVSLQEPSRYLRDFVLRVGLSDSPELD